MKPPRNSIETIVCGRCDGASAKSETGCASCGGYGNIAEKIKIESGHEVWLRPGAWTIYDGKRFNAYDGTPIVVRVVQGALEYHKEFGDG